MSKARNHPIGDAMLLSHTTIAPGTIGLPSEHSIGYGMRQVDVARRSLPG
jgi:hypothetical protein